ncbi:WD domain, G-beta repeat [Gimesia panareensis]|uniref:WD domain, G-beta repeat n=1 Tax=Gimesia panareensis TaxID=2527978 RepID=A0A517Q7Q4_9PLAN|nr:WD40 repeat domain-containing protein [Gimesia panareensis]QDT27611.1 WD domain, G-beta repeat [Gimesia panareensis]
MTDAKEKASRLKSRRIYRWSFIGLLIVIVFVEWYAQSSQRKSVAALDEAMNNLPANQELPLEKFESFQQGFPSVTVDDSGIRLRKIHYRWSGIFKSYHLRLVVDQEQKIVTYDTRDEGKVEGITIFTQTEPDSQLKKVMQEQATLRQVEAFYADMTPTLPMYIPMIAAPREEGDQQDTDQNSSEPSTEPQLEPSPDHQLQIRAQIEKHTPTLLSELPETELQQEIDQRWQQWYLDRFLGSYQKYGHRDPRWDKQAVTFLTDCCALASQSALKEEAATRMEQQGEFIESTGCDDPIVRMFYIRARAANRHPDQQKQMLDEALKTVLYPLQESRYPPEVQLEGSLLVRDISREITYHWTVSERFPGAEPNNSREPDYHWKAAQHLVSVLADRKLDRDERRFLLKHILDNFVIREIRLFRLIVVTLEQSGADPWLTQMLKGHLHYRLAIDVHAMHACYWTKPEKTQHNLEYLTNFQPGQAQIARDCFQQAWLQDPDLPEAPYQVMLVNQLIIQQFNSQAVTPAEFRFWFDQVVRAQFDYVAAYDTLIQVYQLPLFAERETRLLALGEECLQTERFDTIVPGRYFKVLSSLKPISDRKELLTRPAIAENLTKVITGYNARPETSPEVRNAGQSLIAYLKWVNGSRDESRKLVQELGTDLSGDLLANFGVSSSEFFRQMSSQEPENKAYATAKGIVSPICFVNGGKQFLTGNENGVVTVWDVKTQQSLHEFTDHTRPVTSITYSRDRQLVATAAMDGQLILRKTDDFSIVKTIQLEAEIYQARFSPAGDSIAVSTGTDPQTGFGIKLWDTKRFEQTRAFQNEDDLVFSLSWSPDGKQLAATSASFDGYRTIGHSVRIWDLQTGQPVGEPLQVLEDHHGVRWSPDGKQLAIFGVDKKKVQYSDWEIPQVKIVDVASRKVLHTFQSHIRRVSDVAFTTDSQFLLTTGLDRTLVTWNLSTGKRQSTFMDTSERLLSVAVAPDNQLVALSGSEGELLTRPLSELLTYKYQTQPLLQHHCRAIRHMQLDPTGELLAIGDYIDGVRFWNAQTGTPLPLHLPVPEGNYLNHFDIAREGKLIALACGTIDHTSGVVVLYNYETGKLLQEYPFDWQGARCVQFSADGKTLFSNGPEHDVIAWDTATGKTRAWEMSLGHLTHITAMILSPDGKYLYTSSPELETKGRPRIDPKLNRWEIPQTELDEKHFLEPFEFNQPRFQYMGARKLTLSPDGTRLFTDQLQYDLQKGSALSPIQGTLVAVSPVDAQYVSCSVVINVPRRTKSISLLLQPYQPPNQKAIPLSNDLKDLIHNAVFSRDGQRLFTPDGEQHILIWDLKTRRPLLMLN